MTEEKRALSGLTRRSFLKASCVTGALATVGAGGGLKGLAFADEPDSGGEEQVFECACRANCIQFCRHKVYVRDGKIVKVSAGDFPDSKWNRICARGMAVPMRIYDETRVKYPMMRAHWSAEDPRADLRGKDEWVRVSWDEAISAVADKFSSIREEFGGQAIAFASCGSTPSVVSRLASVLGGSSIDMSWDYALMLGMGRCFYGGGMSVDGNTSDDLVNSEVIVMWGQNYTVSDLHSWHFVADAQERGAKLVVIDPCFNQIAAKADMFLPVKPASDAALALSLIDVVIENGWMDESFVRDHTCAPLLVRQDNGKFLRASDFGAAVPENTADDYLAWDLSAQKAVHPDAAGNAALEGAFEVNGVAVRPAFDLLKERAADYAPDKAAEITGIDAQTVVELARMISSSKTALLLGLGPNAYGNGVKYAQAATTLGAITGNIGEPGRQTGYLLGTYVGQNFLMSMPKGPATSVPYLFLPDILESGEYNGEPYPIKAFYIAGGNVMDSYTDQNRTREKILGKMELIVVADYDFNDSAANADIILPVSHWYEYEDFNGSFGQHGHVQASQKAVEPAFDSMPDLEIISAIGKAMGEGEYFSLTREEYLTQLLDTQMGALTGISWPAVKEAGIMPCYTSFPHIAFEDKAFPSPSGRVEFYHENPMPRASNGQAFDPESEHLPSFVEPLEAWETNELKGKYPLTLTSTRSRYRSGSMWAATRGLREIDPEPVIKINTGDAAERGIAHGDYVELFNDRGRAVMKAIVTESVAPGVLSYPKGWQSAQYKAGNVSELTNSAYDPVAVNSNYFDTLVEVRLWKDGE